VTKERLKQATPIEVKIQPCSSSSEVVPSRGGDSGKEERIPSIRRISPDLWTRTDTDIAKIDQNRLRSSPSGVDSSGMDVSGLSDKRAGHEDGLLNSLRE
jgi:hypothetical protein